MRYFLPVFSVEAIGAIMSAVYAGCPLMRALLRYGGSWLCFIGVGIFMEVSSRKMFMRLHHEQQQKIA